MRKTEISIIIQKYLSETYNCNLDILNKEDAYFSINPLVGEPYIKILSYKNSIVVNVSPDLYVPVKSLLKERNRDEIFEFPLVYGHTIHYVPDVDLISEPTLLDGYSYELLEGNEISKLSYIQGFDNSLEFDDNGQTSAKAVFIAKDRDTVIAVAGADIVTDEIWEVGIDVNPLYRNRGLGSILTKKLTLEILSKGIIPIYSASITNIASQMVATRSGFIPSWIDTFGNVFDKYYAYDYDHVTSTFKNMIPSNA